MFGFKKKVNLKIAQSFDSEKTPKIYFIVFHNISTQSWVKKNIREKKLKARKDNQKILSTNCKLDFIINSYFVKHNRVLSTYVPSINE